MRLLERRDAPGYTRLPFQAAPALPMNTNATWLQNRIRSMLGDTPPPLFLGRWLFLRLLGCVYLAAFLSAAVQIRGLIGSQGILPLGRYLDAVSAGAFASDAVLARFQ